MTKRFALTTANGKLTCPELVGYELPEWNSQEDDVERKLSKLFAQVGHNFKIAMPELKTGLIELCKAREKFEFTRQDLIDLVQAIKDYTYESGGVFGYDDREASEFVDIFLSGRTARTPIAIEVEMVQNSTNGSIPVGQDWEYIPATNPDGTVKGRWVYE